MSSSRFTNAQEVERERVLAACMVRVCAALERVDLRSLYMSFVPVGLTRLSQRASNDALRVPQSTLPQRAATEMP